jgi:hypothetical protein
MKRPIALFLVGVAGFFWWSFTLFTFVAYEVPVSKWTLPIAAAIAIGPPCGLLWIFERFGWLKVREIGSDRLFRPGQ